MRCALKPKQTEAVEKALAAFAAGHRGFLCGDKMGLGKTITALAIAERLPKKHNFVAVVCPAFIAPKWRREIEEKTDKNRDFRIVVYTYTDLTDASVLAHAKRQRYDLVIFDEAHYAKSYRAQRTEATLGKFGIHVVAEKLLGLSGTWPPNNVSDMYTWLRATNNTLAAQGFEAFCRAHAQYCVRNQYGLQVRGFKDTPRFRAAFDSVFIGRETFAEPGEVPEPLRLSEIVTPSKALQKMEQELFGDFLEEPALVEKALETMPSFDRIAEFRKRQGLAKIPAVIEYALEMRSEFSRQIIFCYHIEVAGKIAEKLRAKKCNVELVHGMNTAPEERDEIMVRANKADDVIVVATIDALREGIDATGFDIILFAEIDWRAWALEQAEGRLRHELFPRQVRYVYFSFPRGVDRAMLRAVAEKKDLARKVRGRGQRDRSEEAIIITF